MKLERSAGQDTLPQGCGPLGKWPVLKYFLEKKDGKQMETFLTLLFWYVNYFSAPKEVEIKSFRTQLINGDNLNIVCTINIPGL